jgi:hypothetical protein
MKIPRICAHLVLCGLAVGVHSVQGLAQQTSDAAKTSLESHATFWY